MTHKTYDSFENSREAGIKFVNGLQNFSPLAHNAATATTKAAEKHTQIYNTKMFDSHERPLCSSRTLTSEGGTCLTLAFHDNNLLSL